MPTSIKSALQNRARELGFLACGVASAAPSQSLSALEKWIESGFAAGMEWMKRPDSLEKRGHIEKLFPGAKSVVVVAMNYRTREEWDDQKYGKIASYARGLDYHETIKERLSALLCFLQTLAPCTGKICVDSSPVLEREWAVRAGLGWQGKNTLLMSREWGSYVLLGELILDLEIEPDAPHLEQFCGSCTRCLDACPTMAFPRAGVLDATRCISYHTIENKKIAPLELREKFDDWIFGCDICQQVCPWNAKAARDNQFSSEPHLWQRPALPTLEEWPQLSPTEFSRRLRSSPIKRTKRRGMKRNAARALINRKKRLEKDEPDG